MSLHIVRSARTPGAPRQRPSLCVDELGGYGEEIGDGALEIAFLRGT